MDKTKNLNEEKNSSTEQGADNSASAAKQSDKPAEDKEQKTGEEQKIASVNIPAANIDAMIDKLYKNVNAMKNGIGKKEAKNIKLRIALRPNPQSLRRFASSDKDEKRMMRLEVKSNVRWLAKAKPILDNMQSDLSLKIKNRREALEESIKLEKARSAYYISKNQYHIKNKLSKLFAKLETRNARKFSVLRNLEARRTNIHREQFEVEVLDFISKKDRDLYIKCVGVPEYKVKFIKHIRSLLK